MCGIFGIVGQFSPQIARRKLAQMACDLCHRGPDGNGFSLDSFGATTVALGHVRLAVIAPHGGEQPMCSEDNRYKLIFNGEIYNYIEVRDTLVSMGRHFRTASDTEVLLQSYAQWRGECLSRIEGMFAFAIWDGREHTLFMARDPFGQKPLFYHIDKAVLYFSSQIDALTSVIECSDINPSAIADYLLYRYIPCPSTIISRVAQLPPGSCAEYREHNLTINRYYVPPLHNSKKLRRSEVSLERVRELIMESVRLRLRADTEVGVFLSGGVDSGSVLACAAAQSPRNVHSFTVTFGDTNDVHSEQDEAAAIACRFRSIHHTTTITPERFVAALSEATAHRSAPLGEYTDILIFELSKVARAYVKVVLCGEGADEIFGGYPRYRGEYVISKLLPWLPQSLLNAGGAIRPLSPRLAAVARAIGERDFVARQLAWFGSITRSEACRLAPDLYSVDDPTARSVSRLGLPD